MSAWVKVEMGPTWDFKKEKELEGKYLSRSENVGVHNSNLYKIERADGTTVGVWGNTMLDDKFNSIGVGEDVKIVYLGLIKSEKTNREYNAFDVFHKPRES